MENRRVKVFKRVGDKMQPDGEATFLDFGVDYSDIGSTAGAYSVALIERPDGTVESVLLWNIQFIKPAPKTRKRTITHFKSGKDVDGIFYEMLGETTCDCGHTEAKLVTNERADAAYHYSLWCPQCGNTFFQIAHGSIEGFKAQLIPDTLTNVEIELGIDFTELKEQKKELLTVIGSLDSRDPKHRCLIGILNLIDNIQDYVVDTEQVPESEVFDFD